MSDDQEIESKEAEEKGDPVEDTGETADAKLTKEEQMAKFEDALKESDWGHQPC